jgi:hypothetical protein
MRRTGILLVLAVCFLMSWSTPAAAHGSGGIVATNFETGLGGVSPSLPGVRIRLIEAGSRLELRNDGPELVVLGAESEPYLRVGPDGAFENRQSPTAARNRVGVHEEAPAPAGDPGAAPEWRKLSDTPQVRWHDHRTDWGSPRNPPEVEREPGRRHVVLPRWEIPLERGAERSVAFGTLTWIPGPSPAPWFALMGVAFAGVALLGLLRRWAAPLAVATGVVLTADVVHAMSVAFAFAGGLGTSLAKLVTGSFFAFAGWALAVVAIRLLRRGRVDGLYAAVFAGLSMAVFGGLLDLAKLSRSVSLSALPPDLARLCVALSAGGGLGVAAACLVVIQRTPDARRVVGGPAARDDASGNGEDGLDEDAGGGAGTVAATAEPGR